MTAQTATNDTGIRYPKIKVRLTGKDGNAFAIMGFVVEGLRKGKVPASEISAFRKEAMSAGSYSGLLCVCMDWVNVS